MPRSTHGGRHELGQNFLNNGATINYIAGLVGRTPGPILELGAGDGALTRALARHHHEITAIDIDEHRVRRLHQTLPDVRIEHADALHYPLDTPTIVGNIPFHITTPILRRLLGEGGWRFAILLTQWEVARKRAGVGGHTMMTAQTAPWFEFELKRRVPAHYFTPMPSVDAGILAINRRRSPLLPRTHRRPYERFVRAMFTGRGGTLTGILQNATPLGARAAKRALSQASVDHRSLPRDLDASQWVALWNATRPAGPERRRQHQRRNTVDPHTRPLRH